MSEDRPHEKREPHYDLAEVQCAFAADLFAVTHRVARYLGQRDWDRGTVRRVVCDLNARDFYKSQPHDDRTGVWLDIYRPSRISGRMYVKFMAHEDDDRFLVLSFCKDGEPH